MDQCASYEMSHVLTYHSVQRTEALFPSIRGSSIISYPLEDINWPDLWKGCLSEKNIPVMMSVNGVKYTNFFWLFPHRINKYKIIFRNCSEVTVICKKMCTSSVHPDLQSPSSGITLSIFFSSFKIFVTGTIYGIFLCQIWCQSQKFGYQESDFPLIFTAF